MAAVNLIGHLRYSVPQPVSRLQSKDKKDDNKDKNKKDGNDKKDKQDKDKGEKPQPKPSGASKQRIDNLLDAVNNEEKKVQEKVNAQKVQANPKKPEKDW